MTVHEPGKIPGTSDSTDSIHDANTQDPSISCKLTLIGAEGVVASINQTTADHVPQVAFADVTGNVAPEAILDAIRTARAKDPDKVQRLSDRSTRSTTSR